MREAVQAKIRIKLPSAVERGSQQQWSCGENQRKNEMREAESRGNGKTKNFRDLSFFICFDL